MRIPYGVTFTADTLIPVSAPLHCTRCQNDGHVQTTAAGVGSATSFLWFNMQAAEERSRNSAIKDATRRGEQQISLAPCPACDARNSAKVFRFYVITLVKLAIMTALLVFAVQWILTLEVILKSVLLLIAVPLVGSIIWRFISERRHFWRNSANITVQ